jgi:hypothetical protein
MSEKKRERRRRDSKRMKSRMRFLMRHIWQREERWITSKTIGKMAAMHATHDCCMCNYKRRTDGPPASELRRIPARVDRDPDEAMASG